MEVDTIVVHEVGLVHLFEEGVDVGDDFLVGELELGVGLLLLVELYDVLAEKQ